MTTANTSVPHTSTPCGRVPIGARPAPSIFTSLGVCSYYVVPKAPATAIER